MNPADTQRERKAIEIFGQALERADADDRAAHLEVACAGDRALRTRVEALLAHHVEDSFLQVPAAGLDPDVTASPPPVTEQPGDRIGRYKLLELIGEGGCGVVYMAEQEEPVRRRVALKLIRPGMDSRQVIARFEAERQALAMMDHPNIAKVHDGGVTESGRPFFVMELVRGIKLTDYCRDHRLPTRVRLDLFIAVCSAVQHAHQKGIIHRDLKPSNILVTELDGKPVPKVIDFGIVRATEQKLTDQTFFTQFAQFLGTPAYMSPEQAALSGADIDTRSDIYSLGVLLYELLTGSTPFDAKDLLEAGFDEMRRIIRETEPPKPSTRMTQSRLRSQPSYPDHSAIRHPHSAFPTDLDWIVMKCLEKDRARRYENASGLALDIQRHLNSEPVAARPANAAYRFRKMVRRNKLAVAAAAAVIAALVTGLGASVWQFIERSRALNRAQAAEEAQREERSKAETEAEKSKQVAQFLTDMLEGVGPSVALGEDTKLLRKILDSTAERIGTELKDQPEVEVDLRGVIGTVYGKIGDYDKAVAMFEEALVICRRIHGPEHAEVSKLLNDLALELSNQGKLDEAEAMLREALAVKRRLGVDQQDTATNIDNLALVVADRGRFAEAEKLHREALALKRAPGGADNGDVAISLSNLAVVLQQQQKFGEAEAALREALAIERKQNAADTPQVAITLNNLANVVQQQNRVEESETLFREVLALQRKFLGNAHPNVAAALNGLGLALLKQGKSDEAEALLREGVGIEKEARSGAHPQTARLVGNLGRVLEGLQEPDEAETCYREALGILRRLPGKEHADTATWRNRLTILLGNQKKWPEVETMRREALAAARSAAGDGSNLEVADALIGLALPLWQQNKLAEAEAMLLEGHAALQHIPEAPTELHRYALTGLTRLYEAWNQPDKAAEWQQKLDAFEKQDTKPAGEPETESPNQ